MANFPAFFQLEIQVRLAQHQPSKPLKGPFYWQISGYKFPAVNSSDGINYVLILKWCYLSMLRLRKFASSLGKMKMPFSTFLPGPSIQNRLYPTAGGRAEFSIVRKIFLQSLLLPPSTVILGKMAQHARLLALLMAKLKGKSKSVSNMALGQCIGLQHIQRSMF